MGLGGALDGLVLAIVTCQVINRLPSARSNSSPTDAEWTIESLVSADPTLGYGRARITRRTQILTAREARMDSLSRMATP